MAFFISPRSEAALRALFPTTQGREDAPSYLVDALVDAELHRRGQPDASGAFHALSLKEGSLLKEEFDLSTHGHADGWLVEAVLVDPLEFMRCSMVHGFEVGDAAFAAMVRALQVSCPTAKVVRIHTDGLAVLLGPTAQIGLKDVALPQLEHQLIDAVSNVLPDRDQWLPRFTLGQLALTVVDPSHWQVLGPLLWAECERALIVAKRTGQRQVQQRHIELSGRLPVF
jgi:GGDEF domain-containing protein